MPPPTVSTLTPFRAGLILPLRSQHLSRLRLDILCAKGTLVTTLATTGLIALQTPLVRDITLKARLSASTNTLETTTAVLTVAVTIMSKLTAGHSRTRVAETGVDILRCRSLQSIRCRGLDGLLAVAALDAGVICLAAGLVDGVGGEGVAGGGGAGGVCFGVEFGGVVAGGCLDARFVLVVC